MSRQYFFVSPAKTDEGWDVHFPVRMFSLWAALFAVWIVRAGDSGLNVVVVVNQNSANSVQLGNDYCERRDVPAQNLLRMSGWTGGNVSWAKSDFDRLLLNPLRAMLAERGLTRQIDVVLLSMDIPYRIEDQGSFNSTTSVLFYGFKYDTHPDSGMPASCTLPDSSTNGYAFSELPFRVAPPVTAPAPAFLAMMLTDQTLAGAELVLSRGVAGDATFPARPAYLEKTGDVNRNVRHVGFDNAIFDGRLGGRDLVVRIESDSTAFTDLRGLLTGLANLSLPANAFVPGAMGDSLTSFAGDLFETTGQTSALAFLNAGAAGSYGTVVEPCNYTQKFPNPLDYFYQGRGFSVVESYYLSLQNPYQGVLVGEPLCAPFARPGSSDWGSLPDGTVLKGSAELNLTFGAAATNLPLDQVDLFVDGRYLLTMTNVPPTGGDVLAVTLGGFTVHHTVPAGATLDTLVTGLAQTLNGHTNSTQVLAYPTGDRLELQGLDLVLPGKSVTLDAQVSTVSSAPTTTHLTPAGLTFLDTVATGTLVLVVTNAPVIGNWLGLELVETDGTPVSVSVTNTTVGSSIGALARALADRVNATPALQTPDGLVVADFYDYASAGLSAAQFTLYARRPGWPAAQIQVAFTASSALKTLPAGTNRLEDNLTDLRPRNHLHLATGALQLPVSFALDTTRLPDGPHELSAVAYEGTGVRTQTRVSRNIRIQNNGLGATFAARPGGTNVALDQPLEFTVTAAQPNIVRIELFTTGGSVGTVSNQVTAVFPVAPSNLGLGLHPFHALVTDTTGNSYQTETLWFRVVPAITVSVIRNPLALSWPAIPGRRYDVLATTDLALDFEVVDSVTASGPVAQWLINGTGVSEVFYRVRWVP